MIATQACTEASAQTALHPSTSADAAASGTHRPTLGDGRKRGPMAEGRFSRRAKRWGAWRQRKGSSIQVCVRGRSKGRTAGEAPCWVELLAPLSSVMNFTQPLLVSSCSHSASNLSWQKRNTECWEVKIHAGKKSFVHVPCNGPPGFHLKDRRNACSKPWCHKVDGQLSLANP